MTSCSADGCDNPVSSRGLCKSHYTRLRRAVLAGQEPDLGPLTERRPEGMTLGELVAWCLGRTERDGACLVWTRRVNQFGYGEVKFDGRRELLHRLSLLHFAGEPPADKPLAIHSCHNPACINPLHLRWGSQLDNMHDMMQAGRHVPAYTYTPKAK